MREREYVQISRFQDLEKNERVCKAPVFNILKKRVQSSLAEYLENTNRESVQSSRFQDIERERERERKKERQTDR